MYDTSERPTVRFIMKTKMKTKATQKITQRLIKSNPASSASILPLSLSSPSTFSTLPLFKIRNRILGIFALFFLSTAIACQGHIPTVSVGSHIYSVTEGTNMEGCEEELCVPLSLENPLVVAVPVSYEVIFALDKTLGCNSNADSRDFESPLTGKIVFNPNETRKILGIGVTDHRLVHEFPRRCFILKFKAPNGLAQIEVLGGQSGSDQVSIVIYDDRSILTARPDAFYHIHNPNDVLDANSVVQPSEDQSYFLASNDPVTMHIIANGSEDLDLSKLRATASSNLIDISGGNLISGTGVDPSYDFTVSFQNAGGATGTATVTVTHPPAEIHRVFQFNIRKPPSTSLARLPHQSPASLAPLSCSITNIACSDTNPYELEVPYNGVSTLVIRSLSDDNQEIRDTSFAISGTGIGSSGVSSCDSSGVATDQEGKRICYLGSDPNLQHSYSVHSSAVNATYTIMSIPGENDRTYAGDTVTLRIRTAPGGPIELIETNPCGRDNDLGGVGSARSLSLSYSLDATNHTECTFALEAGGALQATDPNSTDGIMASFGTGASANILSISRNADAIVGTSASFTITRAANDNYAAVGGDNTFTLNVSIVAGAQDPIALSVLPGESTAMGSCRDASISEMGFDYACYIPANAPSASQLVIELSGGATCSDDDLSFSVGDGGSYRHDTASTPNRHLLILERANLSGTRDITVTKGCGGNYEDITPRIRLFASVDADKNGLIEIYTIEQLSNMRHNLAGTSYRDTEGGTHNTTGAPTTLASNCTTATDPDGDGTMTYLCGYELARSLDFSNADSYTSDSVDHCLRPLDTATTITACIDTDANTQLAQGNVVASASGVNTGWAPIGDNSTNDTTSRFSAIFDGNGHSISNLYVNRSTDYVGFFGYSTGALRSLGLRQVYVSGANYTGGLAGRAIGAITFSHVTGSVSGSGNHAGGLVGSASGAITLSYATGSVSGTGNNTGGLVGFVSGAITSSHVTGSVSGAANTGGLIGSAFEATITASYATGSVSGAAGSINVGGLAGDASGSITASYATGSVSGSRNIGGLVGDFSGTITASYATGSVSISLNTGGLVGDFSGTITSSYATGSVSGAHLTGGLVGSADSSATIISSYATGSVSGDVITGGLIGRASGSTITASYATGSVSGTSDYTGGLVGDFSGTITASYATGSVSGTSDYTGGLIGHASGTITASYATGSVSGASNIGGLVGDASPLATITSSCGARSTATTMQRNDALDLLRTATASTSINDSSSDGYVCNRDGDNNTALGSVSIFAAWASHYYRRTGAGTDASPHVYTLVQQGATCSSSDTACPSGASFYPAADLSSTGGDVLLWNFGSANELPVAEPHPSLSAEARSEILGLQYVQQALSMLRLTPASGTLGALTGNLNLSHSASTTAINTLNGTTLAWSEVPNSTAIALPSSGTIVTVTQPSGSATMAVIRATATKALTIGGTARTHSATRDWALTILP